MLASFLSSTRGGSGGYAAYAGYNVGGGGADDVSTISSVSGFHQPRQRSQRLQRAGRQLQRSIPAHFMDDQSFRGGRVQQQPRRQQRNRCLNCDADLGPTNMKLCLQCLYKLYLLCIQDEGFGYSLTTIADIPTFKHVLSMIEIPYGAPIARWADEYLDTDDGQDWLHFINEGLKKMKTNSDVRTMNKYRILRMLEHPAIDMDIPKLIQYSQFHPKEFTRFLKSIEPTQEDVEYYRPLLSDDKNNRDIHILLHIVRHLLPRR